MDIATIIGAVLITVAIIGSILVSSDLITFFDVPSLIVVGMGVMGAVFIKWPFETITSISQFVMKAVFYTPSDPKQTIEKIGELAETARRESVFALEKAPIDDPFMKKAMILAADNRPPEVIESILQLEIDAMKDRHKVGVSVLDGMAADGPAFGMIGTLLGLVIMLKNLSDPSAIGPAMAVALLTTFYGSIFANAFALPVKNKIEVRSSQEIVKMNIIIAGTLGIVAGENPRLIKEKLSSFLPPSMRDQEEAGGGAGE